jgi:hypothetical protein
MARGTDSTAALFDEPRTIEALGDLLANLWQVCWVTPDFDRGLDVMRDRYGVENITEVPTEGAQFLKDGEPVSWEVRVAMGSRGGLIAELIEPVGGEVGFYRRFLPEGGEFGLRLHHLACLVPLGDEAWDSVRELLESKGLGFQYTILIPDRARLAYVDTTAEFGHYLELCQLQPADTEFFSGLLEGAS